MQDGRVLAAALANDHRITGLQRVGRHVDALTVHQEVTVANQLARLRPRRREAHAIDRVVEAALQQLQQRLAGDAAAGPLRLFEVAAELVLQHAVDALDLLFLAQLHAVADHLRLAQTAMLPRRHVALLDRALLGVATLALEEQLHALAAAEAANGSVITCHESNSPTLRRTAAVVRDRRDVANRTNFEAGGLQRPDRRLAAGARALDQHVARAHAERLGGVGSAQRRLRGGERRALARTLEADRAGARPRHHRAFGVGDRDQRVVERRLHVHEAVMHDALLTALLERLLLFRRRFRAAGLLLFCFGHKLNRLLLGNRALARTLARARVGLGALPAQRQVAAMAPAAVAADFNQPLDVHGDLLTEIAF